MKGDFAFVLQVHLVAYDHDLGGFGHRFREVLDPVPWVKNTVRTE